MAVRKKAAKKVAKKATKKKVAKKATKKTATKKAAKKAYMNHKKLSKIYMYDPVNKKVHSFDTEGFKNKKKKDFLIQVLNMESLHLL